MTGPTPRGGAGRIALLAAVNLVALGSLTAPAVAGLPVRIADLLPANERAAALGSLLALGAVGALLANPLFGALSDRTRGRFGRRRPWMLGGVVVGLIGVVGLNAAGTFATLALWWILVQMAYNATLAAAAALLADVVSESRRASASGFFTAAAFLGAVPPLLLAALLPAHLPLVSLVMPVTAVLVVGGALTIPDPPSGSRQGRTGSVRGSLPRAFVWIWLQRLAMQSAFSLTTAFTMYLILDRMTHDTVTATPVATLTTLVGGAGVVVGAAVAGTWAQRYGGYVPLLVFGALGLASAAAIRAFAAAPSALWVAAAVGGLAVGTSLAINFALALRALPPGRAGAYLGVLNVAETIPQTLAPVAAAALLTLGGPDPVSGADDNYVALYASAAIVALIGLGALPALRRIARRPAAALTAPASTPR